MLDLLLSYYPGLGRLGDLVRSEDAAGDERLSSSPKLIFIKLHPLTATSSPAQATDCALGFGVQNQARSSAISLSHRCSDSFTGQGRSIFAPAMTPIASLQRHDATTPGLRPVKHLPTCLQYIMILGKKLESSNISVPLD